MGVLRLSTVFPDLADAISSAPADRALNAGWAAARWAVHHSGLSHPVVSAAKVGEPTDAIVALIAELDDQYFELQELCDEGKCSNLEVLAAFGRARAASSLEFAVRDEVAEAVYEASVCSDDVAGLRQAIAVALR